MRAERLHLGLSRRAPADFDSHERARIAGHERLEGLLARKAVTSMRREGASMRRKARRECGQRALASESRTR